MSANSPAQASRAETERLQVIPEACSGCLMCQLACSFAWTRKYNPVRSRILIEEVSATAPFRIAFTSECNDCGICARYCYYGALQLRRKT